MILTVLKTIVQIVNFLLWLLGFGVAVLLVWILSDYNMDSLSDSMMDMVDMVMAGDSQQGSMSRRECHQMSRDVVQEVTVHVSEKLCSIFS